jgi:hypothetical protein
MFFLDITLVLILKLLSNMEKKENITRFWKIQDIIVLTIFQ